MKSLRWIVKYKGAYVALSALLVVLVGSLVAWQASRDLEADRELLLVRSLGVLASTIEGGTINSQAMGAAILLGLDHREVKQSVLGQLPPGAPGVLQGMNAARRQFLADAFCLVDARGRIVACSSEDRQDASGRDISSWPNVQLALRGTPNVYPALGGAGDDRGIYLSAPVRATQHNRSRPIGAVVVKVGADKLDLVLDSWTDGIAVLLSPKGRVFSASRLGWQFRKSGEVAADPLPFSADASEATVQGVRYTVRSLPLDWHDPAGEWRLVVLARQAPWWTEGAILGSSGLAGLVMALLLSGLYTLARHEKVLRHNAALLREAQAIAVMGSYVLDVPSGMFEVSDEIYRLFGVDETHDHSVAGWLGLIHPGDRAMMQDYLIREILGSGKPFDKEYRIIRGNDRQERWVHGLGRLEFDAQGRPSQMHGTVQDITERKLAENRLRLEHEQNRRYLDTTMALMVELDAAGNITMINRAASTILGYAEHELLGRNWFETCLPQPGSRNIVFPEFLAIMAGDRKAPREFENAILCRDGSQRLVTWRNTVVTDAAGKIVGTLSSGLDVTESKKLAQQLETILNESPTGIAVYREDGPCIMANEAFARLIGSTPEEVLQQNFRHNASWQRNGLLNFATQALDTRSTVRQDIEGTTSYGKQVATECIFAPINLSGEPHLLLLINDIMGRVEAERALTESMHQLEQKELSKTRFLAAAGHDLRQPIAAANLFVDALKLSSPTRQQTELIQRLEQSMSVFSGLLECLLDISKLDAGLIQPQLTTFNLAEIFEWLDQNFSQVATAKHLRFVFFFPRNKPLLVRTDVELLKSVLMNLVSNAIKFTSHGGVLISARPRGDSLVLQVWDSGIGIAESHLPHIFEEFYQVSNPQRDREAGLGLGLASCQRRMALLGGRVTCRSRLGRGSVFEISLPVSTRPAEAGTIQAAGTTATAPGEIFLSGKRVVVIEDDKLVSEAMSAMLHARGVEVQLFSNAEQALQHDDVGNADYYIVDHNLGGEYSGLQFLEFMQQKRDEKVRAVILTGETSSRFLSGVSDSPWPVLNKPVTVAQLAARLNQ
jgi:PAS domain S-box-containing protein